MTMHRIATAAALLATVASLPACKGSDAPTAQNSESTNALGPDAKPGVSAGGARLVLPVITGRPGVAYFRVANNTTAKITLAGVHLEGVGKAEMHRTSGGQMAPIDRLDIAPGAVTTFAPGGLHVMAFDIAPSLVAGKEGEMTLTFADGDKLSMPMRVAVMGANAGMAGMSH